jgi:hypothetical protein
MNLAANDSAARVGRVETIAFGKKVFESPTLWGKWGRRRSVSALQDRTWGATMRALAAVLNPSLLFHTAHLGAEIGQMKPSSGDRNGHRVRRIEAEKTDTRLVLRYHIRSNI